MYLVKKVLVKVLVTGVWWGGVDSDLPLHRHNCRYCCISSDSKPTPSFMKRDKSVAAGPELSFSPGEDNGDYRIGYQ